MKAPSAGQREQRALELQAKAADAAAAGLILVDGCDRCEARPQLVARLRTGAKVDDVEQLCASCWKAAGSPFMRGTLYEAEGRQHENELAAREAMLRRGGADRYRVLAGKS